MTMVCMLDLQELSVLNPHSTIHITQCCAARHPGLAGKQRAPAAALPPNVSARDLMKLEFITITCEPDEPILAFSKKPHNYNHEIYRLKNETYDYRRHIAVRHLHDRIFSFCSTNVWLGCRPTGGDLLSNRFPIHNLFQYLGFKCALNNAAISLL